MIVRITAVLFLLSSLTTFAQINLKDSTAQAVTYWLKGDTQTYMVSIEKAKMRNADTISHEVSRYEVLVHVKDSTANSYTIEWTYKNFQSDSKNKLLSKINSLVNGTHIIFLTDEFGAFKEVLNWTEVRDYIRSAMKTVKEDLKDMKILQPALEKIEAMYSTKSSIESAAIKDIQQFHSFYGGSYKLHEVQEFASTFTNIYGGKPFDCQVQVYLDEINEKNNNYVLRSSIQVDTVQLASEVLRFMEDMAKGMNVPGPKKEDLQGLKNEIESGSRYDDSGWLIYSYQTTTVNIQEVMNVEEMVIEIK